jgi:metal-sulfur cluster biosynthetic enzyme
MTEADLLRALRDCYEPSLRRDIVSLGLVQSATLTVDHDTPGANIRGVPPRFIAHVILRAATADETLNVQLRTQIENRLAGLPPISHSEIEVLPALLPILTPRKY